MLREQITTLCRSSREPPTPSSPVFAGEDERGGLNDLNYLKGWNSNRAKLIAFALARASRFPITRA